MNKKHKLIIAGVIVGVIILGVGSFFVYSNFSVNKAVAKGIELMSEKEYNKAIASLELALDDRPSNEEALEYKTMIEKYLEAKKLFDEGKIEEANKEVKDINENYSNFQGLKEDVDNLKNQIDEYIKKDAEIAESINKARQLINDKKYDEAKKILESLEKQKLSEIQKQQVGDLSSVINSELSKIEQVKKAQEESKKVGQGSKKAQYIEKLNSIEAGFSDLNHLYEGSMLEMKQAASEKHKRWDNALNEIYSLLKVQLSKSDMDKLTEKQIQWISYRDTTAKNESLKFEGGTMEGLEYLHTLGRVTKERCYELVNNYMQ